ncbi:hypothetical protein [Pyrobaculum sp.]|uniref:hypothetical protein n=1 Tax=Pyrobaculum sp. TaxID=2004705 RepID=UPI0031788A32
MAVDFMIILPTLNEREGLAKTLDELFSIGVSPDRIIVVDGGPLTGLVKRPLKGACVVFYKRGGGRQMPSGRR